MARNNTLNSVKLQRDTTEMTPNDSWLFYEYFGGFRGQQHDNWEKAMVPHSSTVAWKIPWMEEPGAGYCPWGRKELDTTEQLHLLT